MKNPRQWRCALALAFCISSLCVPAVQAQTSKPTAADTEGARQARAAREAQAEKQKQLFEEKNIPVATQSRQAEAIDVPVDDADAPGAVKQ